MRRLLLFVLSGAMLIGGLYFAAFELLFARIIIFRLAAGAVVLACFGGYLIWTDFVAPWLGIKTWED
jgi:hypothetical protein